jgi:hypothetical protein
MHKKQQGHRLILRKLNVVPCDYKYQNNYFLCNSQKLAKLSVKKLVIEIN